MHIFFLSDIPKLRRRLAGKTLPREKLVMQKSELFVANGRLVAPELVSAVLGITNMPN